MDCYYLVIDIYIVDISGFSPKSKKKTYRNKKSKNTRIDHGEIRVRKKCAY
jgi:hypothetical protein